MSSVSRFTRQVPVSTTYYSSAALTTSNCYVFSPTQSLGNYPPGTIQTFAAASKSLPSLTNTILRDMGKTVYVSGGHYRQVQLLNTTISASFGVQGADYLTFYIAVPMNGLLGGVSSGAFPIAGGQM
uniref:Uncharacterized protein n=1 Tax=viral metagenome TaxID=1070528 RepID=A0A6C0HLE4_9ZZZZ